MRRLVETEVMLRGIIEGEVTGLPAIDGKVFSIKMSEKVKDIPKEMVVHLKFKVPPTDWYSLSGAYIQPGNKIRLIGIIHRSKNSHVDKEEFRMEAIEIWNETLNCGFPA